MKRLLFILVLLAVSCSAQILAPVVTGGSSVAFAYYGYGCNGTSTNTCTVGGTDQTNASTFALSAAFTTGSKTSAVACGVYLSGTPTGHNFKCAIYLNGATEHAPVTNCGSASTAAVAGWNEATLTGCTLSASTAYVVAVLTDHADLYVRGDATGSNEYNGNFASYAAFPTLTGDWSTLGNTWSTYVKMQ